MIENAVNQISGIINIFPNIYKIGISSKKNITIYWKDEEKHKKKFTDTVVLLEWCEQNLKSTLDIKPKKKIVSYFLTFLKIKNGG
jgi:hypothetical protein